MEAALTSGANRAMLHGIYRRLRRHGEDESMIRKALVTHSLQENLVLSSQILRLHTQALTNLQQRKSMRFFNVLGKVQCNFRRKSIYLQLLKIRLGLRSWNAIKEVLTTFVCISITFMFYAIYRACRVGLQLADEKYQALAIPVMQTIEALELAERKKEARKQEMESDIDFERSMLKEIRVKKDKQ